MARNFTLLILRGVRANMPALANGELYYATDTNTLFIGPTPTQIGAGSSENIVQAVVDFGSTEDTTASVTVAATWVTSASKLTCSVVAGQDHNVDEIAAEFITPTVGNIVAGVGFDVWLSAPNGASGKFIVIAEG